MLGIATFAFVERAAGRNALVPADVMRNRDFTYSCAAILFMSAVFFAMMLYAPQYMLKVLDFSPIETGLGMLPMMGVFAAVSFVAGPLYDRLGPKVLAVAGSRCIAAGPLIFALVASEESYAAHRPRARRHGPRRRALLPDRHHRRRDLGGRVPRAASPARSSTCSRSRAARSASA